MMTLCLGLFMTIYAVIPVHAQTAYTRHSIDTDLLTLRNLAVPEFSWHYDDYLQYAPAALMFGLKAGGCEG